MISRIERAKDKATEARKQYNAIRSEYSEFQDETEGTSRYISEEKTDVDALEKMLDRKFNYVLDSLTNTVDRLNNAL